MVPPQECVDSVSTTIILKAASPMRTLPLLRTYRWSCLLNALEQMGHMYFLSSLWVSLCLAKALELLKDFPQTWQWTPGLLGEPLVLAGRPFPLGLSAALATTDELPACCCCCCCCIVLSLPSSCCWPGMTQVDNINTFMLAHTFKHSHNFGETFHVKAAGKMIEGEMSIRTLP